MKAAAASDAVPDLITLAVKAVITGDLQTAQERLTSIDFKGLRREREEALERLRLGGYQRDRSADPEDEEREGASAATKLEVYTRDSFTCWFCGKRTVHSEILMALSAQFPDVMPYRSTSWKPVDDHIIYWTCSASWDHLIPVKRGGSSSDIEGNLVTSCYQCNDLRGDFLVAEIGWVATRPPPSPWRGAVELRDALYDALGFPREHRPAPKGRLIEGPPPVGSLVRATIPKDGKPYRDMFRIDAVESGSIQLSGMWRIGADRHWHVGKPRAPLPLSDITSVELLRMPAPVEGERDG